MSIQKTMATNSNNWNKYISDVIVLTVNKINGFSIINFIKLFNENRQHFTINIITIQFLYRTFANNKILKVLIIKIIIIRLYL